MIALLSVAVNTYHSAKNPMVMIWRLVGLSELLQHVPSSKFMLSLQWRFRSIWGKKTTGTINVT